MADELPAPEGGPVVDLRIFLKNGETLNVPNVKVSVFGEGPFVLIAQRGTEDEFTFVSDNIAGWQTTIV